MRKSMNNKNYYTGEFIIDSINYENIAKNFNIYKSTINSNALDPKKYGESNARLFKAIKKIKSIKSYYYYTSKGEIYFLGSKELELEKHQLGSYLQSVPYNLTELIEDLKNMDELILLKLLSRQIPYEIYEENGSDENKKDKKVKFDSVNGLYFFLDYNLKYDFYRFIEVLINKEKITDRYELDFSQITFTKKDRLRNPKERKGKERISFDDSTGLMIPDENGIYFKESLNFLRKEIGTKFIVAKKDNIRKMRSYFLTVLIDTFNDYLGEYFQFDFIGLENYKKYTPKSKGTHFKNELGKSEGKINIFRTEDRYIGENENKVVPREKALELKNTLESICKKEIIDSGTTNPEEKIENNDWNIFLLNTAEFEELEIDSYKEIKKRKNLISNGTAIKTLEDENSKIALKRVLDELLIKECIKKGNIQQLFSDYKKLQDVGCILLGKDLIKEVKIGKDGEIKTKIQDKFPENSLYKKSKKILEEVNMGEKFKSKETIKIFIIGDKEMVIQDTKLRPYFNTGAYRKRLTEELKLGAKSLSRAKDGFLKHTMGIWINYQEQTYYSLYNGGVKSDVKISPQIKRIVSKEKLTKDEMDLYGEMLNFIYHSNDKKLGTYPFLFKIAREIY